MAKKIRNDYFKLLEAQVEVCVKAANLLDDIFANFKYEEVENAMAKMHEIEHSGDELHHDIHNRLAVEFITPIDQEDILHLVQIIDDITDAIDEVVHDVYMYDLKELPAEINKLINIVSRCVTSLWAAVKELKNFKKPETLRRYLVEVNDIEGEADAVSANAIHNLFKTCTDPKKLIADKAIYESLEGCCDLCEHAADVIELIIIKNT